MEGFEELLYEVFLALGIALTIGKFFEEFFARLGLPPVIGNLLLGVVIGKSLLSILPLSDVVEVFSWFGVSLLLFYAGLETRYGEFMRHIPMYGLITVGEVLSAFTMGYIIGLLFHYSPGKAYFIGAVLVATSISLSVRTLIEIHRLTTIEGRTTLGVAVLDDLAALIIIVAGVSLAKTGRFNVFELGGVALIAFTVWLMVVIVLHRLSYTLARLASRLHVEGSLLALVLGIFMLLAYLTKYIGISYLIIAYATGLAFSEVHGIRRIAESIRSIAIPFSALFFIVTAASINVRYVLKLEYIPFYLAMVGAAFTGKLLGGSLTSYILGYPVWSALRVGVGLFPRAEFCIVAAYFAVKSGILGSEVYLAALIIVLTTNILTPVLLKLVYLRGPEVVEVKSRLSFLRKILILLRG